MVRVPAPRGREGGANGLEDGSGPEPHDPDRGHVQPSGKAKKNNNTGKHSGDPLIPLVKPYERGWD